VSAYAQTPREEMQQMVAQLQKTSNDKALRDTIIKLVAEMGRAGGTLVSRAAKRLNPRRISAMEKA